MSSASLHIQNVEGGFYQVRSSADPSGFLVGGGSAILEQLQLHLAQPRRPPVWLVSGSLLPLTAEYFATVLQSWYQADFLALRESASVREYDRWRNRTSSCFAPPPSKAPAHSLDVALLAPIYEFDAPLTRALASASHSWHNNNNTFRVALATSSRRDGWVELMSALVPPLLSTAAGRPLHIRVFIPIEDDVARLHRAAKNLRAGEVLSHLTVDTVHGDTPLEQAYQLS